MDWQEIRAIGEREETQSVRDNPDEGSSSSSADIHEDIERLPIGSLETTIPFHPSSPINETNSVRAVINRSSCGNDT